LEVTLTSPLKSSTTPSAVISPAASEKSVPRAAVGVEKP
jgi:hypothetical protein